MDLRTLQNALARLAEERAADPLQSPKNVAFALGAETGLLLSLFRGLAERQGLEDPIAREAAGDALTSILVHVAQLSNHVGLDTSAALRARIKGKPAPALAAPGTAAVTLPPAAKAAEPVPPEPPPKSVEPPVQGATEPAAVPPAAPPAVPAAPEPEPAAAPRTKERKRGASEVIAVKVAPAPVAPAHAPAHAVEVIELDDEEEVAPAVPDAPNALPESSPVPPPAASSAAVEAAPAPRPPAPDGPVSRPPDPYEHIDAEEVLDLAKVLAKQLDRSTRDDPVLRDLRDELETLSRSLYAASTKKAWIAGSLRSVRSHLEEALSHSFAEEVRAAEFIGRIDGLLADS